MLLEITTTHRPATDLGYLLHKNPSRLHSFDLAFGPAHVYYSEASEDRCTAALLVEVDPIALVRRRQGPRGDGDSLAQYVNDRPYVASSFLSVAMSNVFGTAMSGRSKTRQELADREIPLTARLAAVPCRSGEQFLRRLFEPLGYEVSTSRHPLDDRFPDWGESRYWSLEISASRRLSELLSHLYVLLPVLDDDKHYWVGDDEIDKLLRRGAGWLAGHPERDVITRRYLKHQKRLTRAALARLAEEDDEDPDGTEEAHAAEESAVEERLGLNSQRMGSVLAVVRSAGAKRVLDLGCGDGNLLRALLEDRSFEEVVGYDVSYAALERAAARLRLDRMPERQRARVKLIQGSLTYRDARISGYDAAAAVEVVEHLDPHRLSSFERVVFEQARPRLIVLTTPNVEYNVRFESLPSGKLRHRDHRFEWTRIEFRSWADRVAERFGYSVRFLPVGPEDAEVGPPTQMAVFERNDRSRP
jgi:3' terminal RNA ribose 2'-O-methyltransferase Hen1